LSIQLELWAVKLTAN